MPLQLRLEHPVGSRVFDIPDRTIDRPITVGRAGSADVQVPSILVSPIHCMIYLYEGQWVIADNASGTGTYVNGQRITEPSYLSLGDIVALGQGTTAPTIEIDPLGVKRQAASYAAAPTAQPATPAAAARYESAPPQPAGQPAPQPPVDDGWAQGGWSHPAGGSAHHRRPARRGTPTGVWVIGAISVVALVGAVVVMVIRLGNSGPRVEVTTTEPPGLSAPNPNPNPVRPATRIATRTPATRAAWVPRTPANPENTAPNNTIPIDNPPPTTVAVNTREKDEAWVKVEATDEYDAMTDPSMALYRYALYQQQNPQTPFARELAQFTERAVDILWWKRVEDLCGARDRHQSRIREILAEMNGASDPQFKARKEEDRQHEEELKQRNEKDLADMGYTPKEPPPIGDSAKMATLRAERTKTAYEKFRTDALKNAKNTWKPLYGPAR